MSKTKKAKTEHIDAMICLLCPEGEQPQFTATPAESAGKLLIDHCKENHSEVVDAETGKIPANRQGAQFLDGRDFYSNTYRWTLPDGKPLALQLQEGPRHRSDPMRY